MQVVLYKAGGNNFPSIKRTGPPKKGPGLDLIVSKLDCDNMTIIFDQKRIPLSFSVKDLESYAEYDPVQKNYLASTNFKNGYLHIMNFNFWKFDLKANYRVIGDHIVFDRLFFLSPGSKFYMAGDMYNLKKPFFDMRFRSQIDLAQTKNLFNLGLEMSGKGSFRAVYKGSFEQFRMQGSGNFQNFVFYSLPISSTKFNLDMTENWLKVSDVDATMFGGAFQGYFSIDPLKGTSIFKTGGEWKNWDGKSLGRLARFNDMVFPIKSSGKTNIRWAENGFKDATGDVEFKIVPYEGTPVDLARAAESSSFDNNLFQSKYVLPFENETSFQLQGRQLQNIKSHLRTPYTDLSVDGNIKLSGEADLNVVSRSEKIPEIDVLFHYLQAYFQGKPAQTQEFWAVKGSADFDGKLDATVWSPFEPRIMGTVVARNTFYHGVPLDRAEANILFYKKLIEVVDSKVSIGNATGTAQSKFFLEDKKNGTASGIDLQATLNQLPATVIASAFGVQLPVDGLVNASIQLNGPYEDLVGQAQFEAFQGKMWGEKWDRATGTVIFYPDALGLRNITAYSNGGYAQASGELTYKTYDFNVDFLAKNIPLDSLSILKENNIALKGTGSGEGSGHGSFKKPQIKGNFQFADLYYGDQFYGNVSSQVKLDGGRVNLTATGVAKGIQSTVQADVHLDGRIPFHADFDIEKLPLEIITSAYLKKAEGITGLVGGKFFVSGTLNPANVDDVAGSIDLVQLNFNGFELKQTQPLDVVLSNDVIKIKNSVFEGENTTIALKGSIYPKQEGRLDLNVSAKIGLEALSKWDSNITSSGSATAEVTIGGTVQEPALTGVMEIKDASLRHESLPNSLSNLTALISFNNRMVTLQSLTANSGGGTVTAGGSATLEGYSFNNYRLDVYAKEMRVQYPRGLRSTVNAELHLKGNQIEGDLVGDIDVLQGIYTQSFQATPTVFGTARVPTFEALYGTSSATQQMRLNIRIHSDEGLMVRNDFANMTTSANLYLSGTLDNPVLVGRLEVARGTVTFRNREYKIVRGALDFQNPYRTEASLNFSAETRVGSYLIDLNFNGTFDRLYHDLSSDPPLPKDDIYALLGIGKTVDRVGGEASLTASLAGEEISRFVTRPITSPLEQGFKKFFGVTKFQIDPIYISATQEITGRITLQKDISSNFSVLYSTNVSSNADEIILLQYQLTDTIQLTGSKDENSRYGLDIAITKSFE
jgi:translocation and assembly module TamB